MPDEEPQGYDEGQQTDASVDDLAATIAAKLAEFQEEDKMLADEEATIKARRKMLKAEIDKAQRITKSLIPRTYNRKKKGEVNPPVEQPQVQTQPVQAQPFKPE